MFRDSGSVVKSASKQADRGGSDPGDLTIFNVGQRSVASRHTRTAGTISRWFLELQGCRLIYGDPGSVA